MEIVTQTLEKPVPAPARRGPGSAVAISLVLHGLAAIALILVPLTIVQWSSSKQQGPFEVTLAEELVSEAVESESQAEEVYDSAEPKPVPPARVVPPPVSPKVIAVEAETPEIAPGQLAFVTVPEVLEPSLEFGPEETGEETPEPEPKPAASKPAAPKSSPQPSKAAKKVSSASSRVVSARVIRNPSPVYPASARDKGQQGTVILAVTVSSKGAVNALRLAKSSGYSVLDAAAQKAVRRWKFAPASRGGIAVASQVRVPIQFRIR